MIQNCEICLTKHLQRSGNRPFAHMNLNSSSDCCVWLYPSGIFLLFLKKRKKSNKVIEQKREGANNRTLKKGGVAYWTRANQL
jgi:hypothetical protein